MGGQACVLYGAAQFSKDVDFLVLADERNFAGLLDALDELKAGRIAVPRFSPEVLARGHAVHFRCQAPGVEGLRIDVMTRLRTMDDFPALWERRTTVINEEGGEINLLSVPDLVEAKKTQREKDWPVIAALVEGHYIAHRNEPNPLRIEFWLLENRNPDRLAELTQIYPDETVGLLARRPLLALARANDLPALRAALDAEVRAEQEKDRQYWEPLKREMVVFRRQERGEG